MNIGDTISGYTILSEVGRGGFGVVYMVEKDSQRYAMKAVLPNADQETVTRFRREARMLSIVNDENVIAITDCDLDNNPPFYIMPLCSESLTHRVRAGMSDDESLTACIDFCKGIYAIHQARICHRDIKPDNALYLNGVLKITDLGGGRFENRDTSTLTKYGQMIYTDGYYPPEYNNDPNAFRKGTRQGDIYMIGKSLYYVMSKGGDVSSVDMSVLPPDVAPTIERCLKSSLNERYDNVEEIIKDLQVVQNVRIQLRQMPKPLEEILKEKAPALYDDLYNLLLNESNDEKSLYQMMVKLDDSTLTALFTAKSNMLPNYIGIFNQLLRNPRGWIQYEYVEVFVNAIKLMFTICRTTYQKQTLLDLAFDLAIQYNRYPAMLIIGKILSNLTDTEARALGVFFIRRKDDIIHMKPNFSSPIHYIVNNLIKFT
ncbi:MAG: serine/threonine protein kinase [Prevotella sp.]|nr:serine/threonine protein kinase [Prevotella sp.]